MHAKVFDYYYWKYALFFLELKLIIHPERLVSHRLPCPHEKGKNGKDTSKQEQEQEQELKISKKY
jgi:hypothetical protein